MSNVDLNLLWDVIGLGSPLYFPLF